jgi:hypothetical protein
MRPGTRPGGTGNEIDERLSQPFRGILLEHGFDGASLSAWL